MPLESKRPPPDKRTFTSPIIESAIAEISAKIADPELAWLFQNCFPNTLDTTVTYSEDSGTEDTFIITGDIDAMWLRDSTNQLWPYLPFAKDCPKLRTLFRGLIRRQAKCVLLDPYANAFYRTAEQGGANHGEHKGDFTKMLPGVFERKYELDSLASVLRLANGYFEATGDAAAFDSEFLRALRLIVETIKYEQAGTPEQIEPRYSFARATPNATDTLPGGGHGNPCRRTGMSRSPFRPSDDATTFQYHVPANAMAAVALRRTADLLKTLNLEPELSHAARELAEEIHRGLHAHGIVAQGTGSDGITGGGGGVVFAYEVDGYGARVFMDDANVPSLLALPYLGCCAADDPVYQATRRWVLSANNPYYHQGNAGKGIGSPHVGMGWIWPLSLVTQALTSSDDAEIADCLQTLKSSHAGTGFMHEAFWMNDPAKYTRDWFAWANGYFGELIVHIAHTRPHLLKELLA